MHYRNLPVIRSTAVEAFLREGPKKEKISVIEENKSRFFQFVEANENFPEYLKRCCQADIENTALYQNLYQIYKDIYEVILLGKSTPPEIDKVQAEQHLDWSAKQSEQILKSVLEYNDKILDAKDRYHFYQHSQAHPDMDLEEFSASKRQDLIRLFGDQETLQAIITSTSQEKAEQMKAVQATLTQSEKERQDLIDRGSFLAEITRRCTDALNIEKVMQRLASIPRMLNSEFIEACKAGNVKKMKELLAKGCISPDTMAQGLQAIQEVISPYQEMTNVLNYALTPKRLGSQYLLAQADKIYDEVGEEAYEEISFHDDEVGEELEQYREEGSSSGTSWGMLSYASAYQQQANDEYQSHSNSAGFLKIRFKK